MVHIPRRLVATVIGAIALVLVGVGPVAAHSIQHAGPYTIAIGWKSEPTFTGVVNAVQVIVTDAAGKPVDDLGPDDLKVVVSTNGQNSDSLSFDPSYDADTGLGTHGEYDAAIMPTAPGDYTFHLTGTIHDQKVDVTVTSGDETFDTVKDPTDIQFPTKLPTVTDLTTRVTQIDDRVTALQGTSSGGQSATDAANAASAAAASASSAAASAQSAADRALYVGAGLGILGIVLGAIGIVLALRSRRPSAA
ncbi:MAG TPA: hypothetical protein VEG29_08510 [Candidatus Binatia bacterium]|nr:hypothetical protein [Candidatus Binatia bacterium]